MRVFHTAVKAALVLRLTVLLVSAQSAPVEWRKTFPGVRSEGLVGDTSKQERASEVKSFLDRPNVRLGLCLFYKSEQDELKTTGDPGTECNYNSWRALIGWRGLSKGPIECPDFSIGLKLGADIALRSVDHACRAATDLVNGRNNPFTLRLRDHEYEIVWIDIRRYAQMNAANAEFEIMAKSARDVDNDAAGRLLKYLVGLTGLRFAVVLLRADPWFFTHCSAPPLFYFDRQWVRLPTKAEYLSGPQSVCSNHIGRISCLAYPTSK